MGTRQWRGGQCTFKCPQPSLGCSSLLTSQHQPLSLQPCLKSSRHWLLHHFYGHVGLRIFTGGRAGWNHGNLMIIQAVELLMKEKTTFKHVFRGSFKLCCWLPVLCNYLRSSVQETWFSVSVIQSSLCGRSSSHFSKPVSCLKDTTSHLVIHDF